MITNLVSPSTATAIFSANDLPEEVHEPILKGVVNLRVISWSMSPTLQKGDYLELGQPGALHTGDVIVFRQNHLFICHRIDRLDGQHLYMQGDASEGPPERINSSEVVGRVIAILRNGTRLAVPPRPDRTQFGSRSRLERYAEWGQEQSRSLLRTLVRWVVALPFAGLGTRRLLGIIATVDVMEQAPLRSVTSYAKRHTFRLCHSADLQKYLFSLQIDHRRIRLVIRAGPLYLGTCDLSPWSLSIRPAAVPLGLEAYFHELHRVSETGTFP